MQNDAEAIRAIMRSCNRRLYRIARSVVREEHEAEDVMQAAYGRAFTSLSEFRGESSICTWLARIVLYEALGRLRRRGVADHISMQDQRAGESLSFADKQPDPERIVAQREIQRLLERAIDQLPQKFRMVLVTRTIEGMSVEETAALLGIRPETVKTRLHRARALLRARLQENIGPLLADSFPFEGERCRRITASVLERLRRPRGYLRTRWGGMVDQASVGQPPFLAAAGCRSAQGQGRKQKQEDPADHEGRYCDDEGERML
jgi:RNA polymerase sigma-70 factor (ECF subfamily)